MSHPVNTEKLLNCRVSTKTILLLREETGQLKHCKSKNIHPFYIQKILIVPQKKGLIIPIFDLIFLTEGNKY